MKVINISRGCCGNYGKAIIGVYFPNGVFRETDSNRGISYVLDHVLFLSLLDAIDKAGDGDTQGFTYHGYTCFLITTNSDRVQKNLVRIEDVLCNHKWIKDVDVDLESWISYRKEFTKRNPTPVETLYYAQRIPESPLAKTLSAGINFIPSFEDLREWCKKYLATDKIRVYISGDSLQGAEVEQESISENYFPLYNSREIMLKKHLPWRRSNLIFAIPYSTTMITPLVVEAFCQWLKPSIAASVNNANGWLHSAHFYFDIVPELRIQMNVSRGNEQLIIDSIQRLIEKPGELSQKQINSCRNKVQNYYAKIARNPLEWNRFAGYNAMTGNRYNIAEINSPLTYETITENTVIDVLLSLQHESSRSVFASAVR